MLISEMCVNLIWFSTSSRFVICSLFHIFILFLFYLISLIYFWMQVFAILDEVFIAGEVMETSKPIILSRVAQMDDLP